jgi:hypothetical protein
VIQQVNGPPQVLPQSSAQKAVHNAVLVAGAAALETTPLQLQFKGLEFVRKTSDLIGKLFHCLLLGSHIDFENVRQPKKWQTRGGQPEEWLKT